MSNLKDLIQEKIKYILENERDENVLMQLNEDLEPYQLQLGKERKAAVRSGFSRDEIAEINAACESSKNDPENLVPHEEVMVKLWKQIEKYSGKNERKIG